MENVTPLQAARALTDQSQSMSRNSTKPVNTHSHSILPTDSHQKRKSQATRLVELAADTELWHTPENEAFGSIEVEGHREHWPLESKMYRRWLAHEFHKREGTTPNTQALQDARSVLTGKALFESPQYEVHVRLAECGGSIYLDLANDKWQAVKIDSSGCYIVDKPPAKFKRPLGMLELPSPKLDTPISELRSFVNLGDDDWILFVACLVAMFRPRGPYPILILHGEQGSAKSTLSRVVRALVDPSIAPLRSPPRDVRDLMIAATNSWCISLDNLSHLSPWISDAICRLSTGGGFATRELYTNSGEVLFDAQRPVVLNGIEELAVRGDILDRAIIFYLPSISKDKRRPESEFWQAFQIARPRILGALLNAVAGAIRGINDVVLNELPRMADFALLATAAEPYLGLDKGDFIKAYTNNQAAANELVLESSPVVPSLREVLTEDKWEGTATDLLKALNEKASEATRELKSWPKAGRALSNTLRRLTSNLRTDGLDVQFGRKASVRQIVIRKVQKSSVISVIEANSASQPSSQGGDFASQTPIVCVRPDAYVTLDDDDDAEIPTHSNEPEVKRWTV